MSYEAKYLYLVGENIPCWYDISFDARVPAIIVKVHKDFLKMVPSLKNNLLFKTFTKQFGFSGFSHDLEHGNFGFEDSFERIGQEGPFIVFQVKIPVFERVRLCTCDYCQGNKKDVLFGGDCSVCKGKGRVLKMLVCDSCQEGREWSGEECRRCKGKGKVMDSYMDWKRLYAVSASFTIFFSHMGFGQCPDKVVNSKFPQLLTVQTITIEDSHGGSLDGTYSIPLTKWLSSFPEGSEIREMSKAMAIVWKKMHGKIDRFDKMHMYGKVAYEKGWLNVGCPGSACGLHPSASDVHRRQQGHGYEFACHNVDTPMQQITLLAGLAAMCDRARKEIKQY